MPAPKGVIGHEEDEHARPNHAAPIHLARRRVRSGWEELKDPEYDEKAQRDDVDRVTGFAEMESRWWERFAAEPLLKHACGTQY